MIPYHLILIFFVFFSSSFVCLFPWFWLLSFLRRYVHLLFPNASPSLRCFLVVRHAFVLFFIFFMRSLGCFLFLSVGLFYFYFLSLHRLIWTSDVCLYSLCSLSWWFVHTLLSLWVVAARSPGSSATPWARLGELMLCDHSTEQFDPLFFSVCCGGHSLWSLFFWKLHYPFFLHRENNKGLLLDSSTLIMNPFLDWLIVFPLSGCMEKGIVHLLNNVALLSLSYSCKWIWRVTVWLRPAVVLDRTGPNCGREAWAEERAEREAGIVQIIHAFLMHS